MYREWSGKLLLPWRSAMFWAQDNTVQTTLVKKNNIKTRENNKCMNFHTKAEEHNSELDLLNCFYFYIIFASLSLWTMLLCAINMADKLYNSNPFFIY